MSRPPEMADELWEAYSHWQRADALAREVAARPGHEDEARVLREYSEALLETALLREALRVMRRRREETEG